MNALRSGSGKSPTIISSVLKAVKVLTEVARHPNGTLAGEVAVALNMPAPSAYHVLNTLTISGILTKGEDRRYRLGPLVGALSSAYYLQNAPDERLVAPLIELARATGETTYLTGWRDREIEVIASAEGSHAVRVPGIARGTHGHAHARASGKLLLALAPVELRDAYLARHELVALTPRTIVDADALHSELERIPSEGYAFDDEEFAEGVSCISVPLIHQGLFIGAYTISAPTERLRANREALLSAAQSAATAAVE
jgi:IclR family transcriptional regulator, acetate operon repressor